MIYHLQKDSKIWMTRALKEVVDFYNFSLVGEAFDRVRKSPAFGYSSQTLIFSPAKCDNFTR